MTLSPAKQKAIADAIRDQHLVFMVEVLGPKAIASADYARLKREGKLARMKPLKMDIATAAHVLGLLAGTKSPKKQEELAAGSFWRVVSDNAASLTPQDTAAIKATRARIGQYITGLSSKMETQAGHAALQISESQRKRALSAVRTHVAAGVEEGANPQTVAAQIRAAAPAVQKDWLQIAQTEMHNAMEEAKVVSLARQNQGRETYVYKRPRPDACPFCVLLYLKPDKVTPRVFKLSELTANGTNVGRKAKRPTLSGAHATEWQAVVGAVHPWCQCSLHELPPGMGFNAQGQVTMRSATVSKAEVEQIDTSLLDHVCEQPV